MTNPGEPLTSLTEAVRALRDTVGEAQLPLPLPSADPAGAAAAALHTQIDDYTLPRLHRLDAPLLVALGGPTGAGKSTLLNSVIRAPASAAGVVRPTTHAPVLVCHPSDAAWFRGGELLAGLVRTSSQRIDPEKLHVVTAPALPAGCAFLDTPDIDSVAGGDHGVAHRLLAAADLWLFVTTSTRYADAVPWDSLRTAHQRGVVTALALNRTDAEPTPVVNHLGDLLASRDLAGTPLFVLPESELDGHGMLPEQVVEPVRSWFDALTGAADARDEVVRRTLDGALAATSPAVEQVAAAVDDQVTTADELAEQVGLAYGAARAAVERGVTEGTLVRGEVLARWWEITDRGGGGARTPLAVRLGHWWAALVGGRPRRHRRMTAAVETTVAALVRSAAVDAAEQTYRGWRAQPGGEVLLAADAGPNLSVPQVTTPRPGSTDDEVARVVRSWSRDMRDLLRAGDPSVPEVTDDDLPRVLVAALGRDGVTHPLAGRARQELLDRLGGLLDTEAARYLDRLTGMLPDRGAGRRLRAAAAEVQRARSLTGASR